MPMNRVVAVVILAVTGFAAPAQACSTKASSTFCPEGWVAQPVGGRTDNGQALAEQSTGAWLDDGGETDPAFFGEAGVYVDGAVVVDDPIPEVESQL